MILPKAFPQNSFLQNIKKFNASPIDYMREATELLGSPLDLNLAFGKFVLVTDPEQAQHVLATNHENYIKAKGYKQIARVLGDGLLTAEGDYWKRQRKILQPSFHKPELAKLLPSVWLTGHNYINQLSDGQELALDTEMNGLTLTVLLNSLIHYHDEELLEKMADNIIFGQEFIVKRIRSIVKWPVWLPTGMNRRYHQMMKESNQLIQKCVDSRHVPNEEEINDILDVLLKNYDAEQEFTKIRNELLTFLVAGHETSALGMTWTLHLLAHYPEIQDRLFEEVRELKTLDDLDLMNFGNLKYTQNVIKESLRIYPPIWNIVREAKGDDTVGGFKITSGQQVMNSILEIHHNKDYWSDSDVFDPDRFDRNEIRHKFQYIPFGAGPRFCIGNNFAMFEMLILIVQFVHNFKLEPGSPRHIGFNPLLTLRPNQEVKVILKKRQI